MPATPPTTDAPNNTYYYYWVAAFVIVLLALVAGCGLFFAAAADLRTESTSFHPSATASSALVEASMTARGSLDNDLDNDGQVDGMTTSQLASGKPVRGQLDNDLDSDGHPDGMANPLVGLGLVFLLIPSVGGSLFLLSLYKLPMVGCDYCLTLERPG